MAQKFLRQKTIIFAKKARKMSFVILIFSPCLTFTKNNFIYFINCCAYNLGKSFKNCSLSSSVVVLTLPK